jgi:hypothetical protein
MQKFILKISLFAFSFLFLSLLLQKFIDQSMRHASLLNYGTWNDILDSRVNADLIFQGSSRAKVQFSPPIFDSALQLNSCNLGMEGTGFNLQYCRFQLLVQNNKKPKYVIQNIDCNTTLQNNIYQIEQYIPYLGNKTIRDGTAEAGVFQWKDFYIPLYKYTRSLFTKDIIINGMRNLMHDTSGTGAYKNYTIHDNVWDSSFYAFKNANPNGYRVNIDSSSINCFIKFLDYCKHENIEVIFVYAPEYIELQRLFLNRDSIVKVYRNFALKYDIPMFDYSGDSICLSTKYFYNSQHLNNTGVAIFNTMLANELKKVIR